VANNKYTVHSEHSSIVRTLESNGYKDRYKIAKFKKVKVYRDIILYNYIKAVRNTLPREIVVDRSCRVEIGASSRLAANHKTRFAATLRRPS
jgi:succinate dehydrogenase/fumarate reductase-like Fe-S protein